MPAVREALDYAQRKLRIERLLLSEDLRATAGSVFLERYGNLIELTNEGQQAMQEVLSAYLARLHRDFRGLPDKLYPITRPDVSASPQVVVITPQIAFGQPIIESRAIKTSVVADRFAAGESILEIARDYDLEVSDVEEGLRYERAA